MTAEQHVSLRHLRVHRFVGLAQGPKLIVTGAVHGNETAGTKGIGRVIGEIERGAIDIVRGSVTFVPVCNPLAYAKGQRMGERNLNRRLQPTATPQDNEDCIANALCPLLAEHEVLLDLHSFRSPGRAFVMRGPADNRGELEPFAHAAAEAELARHVGPNRIVEGWMSAYAAGVARRRAQGLTPGAVHEDPSYGVGTTEYMRSQGGYGITLECGQHDDPQGPEVAYTAIRQTLALLGQQMERQPGAGNQFEPQLASVSSAPSPSKAGQLSIEFVKICAAGPLRAAGASARPGRVTPERSVWKAMPAVGGSDVRGVTTPSLSPVESLGVDDGSVGAAADITPPGRTAAADVEGSCAGRALRKAWLSSAVPRAPPLSASSRSNASRSPRSSASDEPDEVAPADPSACRSASRNAWSRSTRRITDRP